MCLLGVFFYKSLLTVRLCSCCRYTKRSGSAHCERADRERELTRNEIILILTTFIFLFTTVRLHECECKKFLQPRLHHSIFICASNLCRSKHKRYFMLARDLSAGVGCAIHVPARVSRRSPASTKSRSASCNEMVI